MVLRHSRRLRMAAGEGSASGEHSMPQAENHDEVMFRSHLANYIDELENFHVQQADCVGRQNPKLNCNPLPHHTRP